MREELVQSQAQKNLIRELVMDGGMDLVLQSLRDSFVEELSPKQKKSDEDQDRLFFIKRSDGLDTHRSHQALKVTMLMITTELVDREVGG
jgi:hypothetical protein